MSKKIFLIEKVQGATNSFLISVSNTFVDYRQVGHLIRVRGARLLFQKIRLVNSQHCRRTMDLVRISGMRTSRLVTAHWVAEFNGSAMKSKCQSFGLRFEGGGKRIGRRVSSFRNRLNYFWYSPRKTTFKLKIESIYSDPENVVRMGSCQRQSA